MVKENKKDHRIDSLLLETVKTRHEPIQSQQDLCAQEDQKPLTLEKLEFFTGFAWCQALLFKSWIDASDKIVKIQKERVDKNEDMLSLYVDVHEEVFTNLFKSQLYAQNLGWMINGSMLMMKNYQNFVRGYHQDTTGHRKDR